MNQPEQRGTSTSLADMTTPSEHQDAVTVARNLQGKFRSGETAFKSLPTKSNQDKQYEEQSSWMSFHDEKQSPVPSVMSMKSDQSMDHPITITVDTPERLQLERSDSSGSASFEEAEVSTLTFGTFSKPPTDLKQRLCHQHYREHSGHEVTEWGQNESLQSKEAEITSQRGHLTSFLGTLGLLEFYPNKLTLRSLQKISSKTISDQKLQSLQEVPLAFLRKLLMVNAKCQKYTIANSVEAQTSDDSDDDEDEAVNPVDLVTALYLCADSFLQQEMSMKMSMCQFAVPFLLPQCGDNPCTLMLWALRNIYKEWRPHALLHTKSFVEDSVVHAHIPLLTFVRLNNCSLSKSQILNHVLSDAQQHFNYFAHRDMSAGNVSRKIANGLVEIVWCLPCGQSNTDVFPEPVAIANLRGGMSSNYTQFKFLMEVSTAVFVFLDTMTQSEEKLLDLQDFQKTQLFLVINSKEKKLHMKYVEALKLQKNHVLMRKPELNMAKSTSQLIGAIKLALDECKGATSIEQMSETAEDLGISVDETKMKASAKNAADNIINGIGVHKIADYKMKQLPLQGKYLKEIAHIEVEECRLQNAGALSLEKYKAKLHEEKRKLREQQATIKTSQAMGQFIQALSTTDKKERSFFLRWMALRLDSRSREHLTELRRTFKLVCNDSQKDNKSIMELDQQLLNNSLGIEHYMRELGQIYESKQSDETRYLPSIAANLLLDGYPLELLDGDTSNIPERWVTDILKELHNKVGCTRLLVVSVLGVQSTGKSTLLNTMFGVQFPVSSGRCTRGIYMLFLPVDEELKEELKCDFFLLIDTEGLKSPQLAKLDGSYEHDNQLATLVIGLSDVTIINIAMENAAEMKDVLQIAVHAFLRMKQLGKKPICHFVHQNVSAVSAHDRHRTDQKYLLEHLNEMTQIAADMENQFEVKFTDVLDYEVEKNNWYIPALWHGTPPMAPVNSGYSEAVHEFKQSLFESVKSTFHGSLSEIPDFLEWMSSLWKAVKHENFIFSFRNTLVASAYDNLCKEFSGWEWAFRKCVYSWLNNAETQISNTDTSRVRSLSEDLELDSFKLIEDQTAEMKKNLKEYYKRRDKYVNLVERYRAEFEINIKGLMEEMTKFVENKLNSAVCLIKDMERVEKIQKQHTDVIEQQVVKLLKSCRKCNRELSDSDLKKEFEKMWGYATRDISGPEEKDIPSCVMRQLRANLTRRNVHEELSKIRDLTRCGLEDFKVKHAHITHWNMWKKLCEVFTKKNIESQIQIVADNIIQSCERFIEDSVSTRKDYQDIFITELFDKIDTALNMREGKTNTKFETDLKVHICGIAARRFLEMHRNFLSDKNPQKDLERSKDQYLSDFIDSYRQRNQCIRKAQDFTQLCIKPAVTEYINRSLGIEIVDGMLSSSHSSEYSSRSYFQYMVLSELLEKDDFKSFVRYIQKYELFVNDWIYNQVVKWLSKDMSLLKLKGQILKTVIQKITETVGIVQSEDSNPNATVFVDKLCIALSVDISLPMNTVRGVLFQMSCKRTPFIENLLQSLDDLKKQLDKEFAESANIKETLSVLTVKPENEIFKRVFGCGEQCPFCKIPCEAGGKAHTQHHATIHCPEGLGNKLWIDTKNLCEVLCTTSVFSDARFKNADTNFKWHPYKQYRKIYPNWNIAPDPSIEASDYWKYVLVTYNSRFAEEYEARPAVCPKEWHSITKEQALDALKTAFNVK